MICDGCGTSGAAFIITKTDDGDTLALCAADTVEWCRMMLAALVAVPDPGASAPVDGAASFPDGGDHGQGNGASGAGDHSPGAAAPGPDDDDDDDEDAAAAGAGVTDTARPSRRSKASKAI